ncbi:hypothetical protein MB02_16540 [Croceicoccus estronivorus]|uniref:lipopolysaccharide biosynthesis protein n=1 Tax=Croceicoccus estronivorus TaxID=1172626 RepID=UPI0008322F8B|nr:oligosaccharide flippase family protein [Croceicoccus estronivorus]OCC22467.1 hypothetical protein MB02_16540 [Croceicoccus estronivorus]
MTIRRVLGNTGWLLSGKGVNAALSLIYLALATRALGLEDYGRFALVVSLAQAITGIVTFQAWQLVVRWGAEPLAAGRTADLEAVTGFAFALDLASLVGGSFLSVATIFLAGHLLGIEPGSETAMILFCLAMMLTIRSTPIGILRLHGRYDLAAAADAVTPLIRAAGAGIVSLTAPGLVAFLAVWAVAELLASAAFWYFAMRLQSFHRNDISLITLPRREPGLWRFAWSTNLSAVLSLSGKQIVTLIVGAAGGPAVAGGYRVASQLGQATLKLGQSLGRAIYPELVRNGEHAAKGLVRQATRLSTGVAVLTIAIALLLGEPLINLIAGPDFAFAVTPMQLLAVAAGIELIGASWENLLVARGQAGTAFILRAIPFVALFASLPVIVPRLGLDAAAGAVACASLWAVISFVLACRHRPVAAPVA